MIEEEQTLLEEEIPQNKYNANDILTDWYDANEE